MNSETFLARVTSAHKIMVPKEYREKLGLKPRQLYQVTLSDSESFENMNFLAKLQTSGQIVIPAEVYEENELRKGQILTATITVPQPVAKD
ncbi:MAG: hypothetical protein NTV61_06275 [Candidatus Bathyarchaeota archaeon]|nr:hypothetical protein [Candidatus Bathyarchaeota archaeon]